MGGPFCAIYCKAVFGAIIFKSHLSILDAGGKLGLERKPTLISLDEAMNFIGDGMTISIGGFLTSSKPMAMVREIIRRGLKGLTLIAFPSSLDVDLLVAAGCVSKLIVPYVGAESLAPVGPFFRLRAQRGEIEVLEVDVGIVMTMLKAAQQGMPYLPWRGGVGTSLPHLNPMLKLIKCPFTGQELIAVPAVTPQVALLHAAQSDPYGNIRHFGPDFADPLIAQAADFTIVQVEEIIPNEEVKRRPRDTTIPSCFVSAVVHLPFGAHPFFSPFIYTIDVQMVKEYLDAAEAYASGDSGPYGEFMAKYIFGPASHQDYLESVGRERLESLKVQK